MNISLENSIRTCKIDSGWANKLQSDRFLNPSNMVCPTWNGFDSTGRSVCPDSFNTKTAGCNSAMDRVFVENMLRPQYMQYVTLDAEGITGDECNVRGMPRKSDSKCRSKMVKKSHKQTGQFGLQTGFGQNIRANCTSCTVDDQAQESSAMRRNQYRNSANRVHKNKRRAGN